MTNDVQVTVTMPFWGAVALLLTPLVAVLFLWFTRWADEQRWIEDWWERRQGRKRAGEG